MSCCAAFLRGETQTSLMTRPLRCSPQKTASPVVGERGVAAGLVMAALLQAAGVNLLPDWAVLVVFVQLGYGVAASCQYNILAKDLLVILTHQGHITEIPILM